MLYSMNTKGGGTGGVQCEQKRKGTNVIQCEPHVINIKNVTSVYRWVH